MSDRHQSNFFVRFRKQVDNHVSQAVDSLKGRPEDAKNISREEGPGSLNYIANRLRASSIRSWSEFSAYSPQNLSLLPQPVPRDAPAGSANCFTFEDAFEDLLAISSGNSLKDLPQPRWDAPDPYCRLARLFSTPDWSSRLEKRGLWNAYFPPQSFVDDARQIFNRVESTSVPSACNQANQAEKLRGTMALIKGVSMCPEEQVIRLMGLNAPTLEPTFFDILGLGFPSPSNPTSAILRELDELYNPWAMSLGLDESRTWKATPEAPHGQPDTMEDLFPALTSDVGHIVSKSLSSLWKIMDGTTSYRDLTANTESGDSQAEVFVSEDGRKTVQSTEQYVQDGMTKHTVTSEQYDRAGNLVQRTVTVRTVATTDNRSTGGLASGDEHEDSQRSDGYGQETRKDSRTGWFWTGRD